MVTTIGYQAGEFLLASVVTYLFLIIYAILMILYSIFNDRGWKRSLIGAALAGVIIAVTYMFPVRIGTVMFINGIIVGLSARLTWKLIDAFKWTFETNDGQENAWTG